MNSLLNLCHAGEVYASGKNNRQVKKKFLTFKIQKATEENTVAFDFF